MKVLFSILALAWTTSAFAQNVTRQEVNQLQAALQNPQNPTAKALLVQLNGLKQVGVLVDTKSIRATRLNGAGRYSMLINLVDPKSQEQSQLEVDEMAVVNNTAYVFSYKVYRSNVFR